jgi:hypothetical protein
MYEGLTAYYGDLHSHCNVGYAHGSLADAFHNARLQLDFTCITVHAHWPDMPRDDPRLDYLVAYHTRGFARTAEHWPRVREMVAAQHRDGEFVSFLGFEWHSNRYGDHNVYFKGAEGEIVRAGDMDDMRRALDGYAARGIETMLIPHHIGYKTGYRGYNWAEFNPQYISVVEIMSMHGASESPAAPRPYLHTMGPRDWRSTLQYGLQSGAVVGVVGSTDHHSAHPGSYGHGLAGVWADDLTREGIWRAIRARRTYALTGDRIALQFGLNDAVMGAVIPATPERHIAVDVTGGSAIDTIEIVHNNRVIHRYAHLPPAGDPFAGPLKVHLEVGWGERGIMTDWQADIRVEGGELLAVEPRFRGYEIVAPQADEHEQYAFSAWGRPAPDTVRFQTRTWGNLTTTTPSMQGMCFEVRATPQTRFTGTFNGQPVAVSITDLLDGPYVEYLSGFVSPAICFYRAVPQAEYRARLTFPHTAAGSRGRDWYYVRVRQQNDHWAWSSPIWVEGA